MEVAILSQDEKLSQGLSKFLTEYSAKRLIPVDITTYSSVKNFLNSTTDFDILFINDATGKLGFQETIRLCRTVYKENCLIIMSSNPERVYEAFEYQAHRFLLKPISSEAIFEALDAYRRNNFSSKAMIVKTASGFKSLRMDEIVYVEAERKVATIHTKHNSVQTYTPYADVLEQLPEEYFFTCHRAITINMDYVGTFTSTEIQLRPGTVVPLSRRRKIDFCMEYNKYVRSHTIN